MNSKYYRPGLDDLAAKIADWRERKGFRTDRGNIPEKIALCHSELSEALEANRDDNWDNFTEELADTMIRIFDICGSLRLPLAQALARKMEVNEQRPHKHGRNY